MWQIDQCLIVRFIRRGLTSFSLCSLILGESRSTFCFTDINTVNVLVMIWIWTGRNRQDDSIIDRLSTLILSLESELLHPGAETGHFSGPNVPAVPPKFRTPSMVLFRLD